MRVLKRAVRCASALMVVCAVFFSAKADAEAVAWVFDDSKRTGEVKCSCSHTVLNGIETFGFAWDESNELLRFRTIPAFMKIIIR